MRKTVLSKKGRVVVYENNKPISVTVRKFEPVFTKEECAKICDATTMMAALLHAQKHSGSMQLTDSCIELYLEMWDVIKEHFSKEWIKAATVKSAQFRSLPITMELVRDTYEKMQEVRRIIKKVA